MAKENHILPIIAHRLFTPPHLPRKLIFFSVLCMISNVLLILLRQPNEYWYSYRYGVSEWISPLLAIHPLFFVGIAGLSLIIIVLLLDGLSLYPAFILWVLVNFIQITYLSMTVLWILYKYNMWLVDPAQSVIRLAISIVAAGAMGLLVAKTSFPDVRLHVDKCIQDMPIKVRLPRIILISVITLWFLLLSFGLYRSVSVPVSRWRVITPEHTPGSRANTAIAYNTDRGRAVLFGGDDWADTTWYKNDTWEWDGKDWKQMIVDHKPSPRSHFSMAYDEINKNIVLFGGKLNDGYLSDTWIWNEEEWVETHPSSSPSARAHYQMIYDPQRQKIVLYGGYDGNYLNDGWEWDGEEWQAIHFESFTPDATSFLMFYDQALDRIVVHISWGGTWYWEGTNWWRPVMDVNPHILGLPVAYDIQNQCAVIFMGYKDNQFMHETWIYKNMNWRKLDMPLEPTGRWGQASFYDPVRKKVIIFGGYDGKDYLNDMWELVLSDNQ
jgi:hypothetical protein